MGPSLPEFLPDMSGLDEQPLVRDLASPAPKNPKIFRKNVDSFVAEYVPVPGNATVQDDANVVKLPESE